MGCLDQQDTDTPYAGTRRMPAWVQSQGDAVPHNRGARLLPPGDGSALSQASAESGASGTPGLSGLAAAYALAKEGWKVTVLDARDRIGGRVFTHRRLQSR